jgi:phosphatidate phosphatase APP1
MSETHDPDRRLVLELAGLADRIERGFDLLKGRLAAAFDRDDPLQILPYRGYGTPERLTLLGRVLQDEPIGSSRREASIWRNLGDTWKRLESDEVPGVPVRARCRSWQGEAVTDEEGYFRFEIPAGALDPPLDRSLLWHEVELEMTDPRRRSDTRPVAATGQVLVPPADAELGVISDIDDTVVETGVTHRLAMARTVFLRNAHTRLPFPGVGAFYDALHKGPGGHGRNPVFFVSSSPWNLYDLLAEFMELHGIPRGPLLLRDFGLDRTKILKTSNREHKLAQIRPLLETYPQLPFVLIGDSGEQDPEIYREVVRLYPERVRAIYIRDVTEEAARDEQVRALAREIAGSGTDLLLVPDTEAAAAHAADRGWIRPERIADVRGAKAKDEVAPKPSEALADPAPGNSPMA